MQPSLNTYYDNPYIGEEVEFYKKAFFILSHSYGIRIFQGGREQCLFFVVTFSTIRIFLAALNRRNEFDLIFIFLIRGVRTSYNQ